MFQDLLNAIAPISIAENHKRIALEVVESKKKKKFFLNFFFLLYMKDAPMQENTALLEHVQV